MQFEVDRYHVKRISTQGAWLVTTISPVDLGLLFLRPQEFYECANPDMVGKPFTLADYIKWYAEEQAGVKNSFSYFDDFRGYNISGEAITRYFKVQRHDFTYHDMAFARIAEAVRQLQGGDFYLIGACDDGINVAEHEIAHSMYYLLPAYRLAADELVMGLSRKARSGIYKKLMKEGYSKAVLVDETQAYMSTGLFDELDNYEPLRLPFIKNFTKYRKAFVTE